MSHREENPENPASEDFENPGSEAGTKERIFPPSIRTVGKSRPRPGFSYAIGSSTISLPLIDLPMFEFMTLRYSDLTPILTMASPLKAFPLLRCTYSSYPVYQSMTTGAGYSGGERCAIEVLLTPYQHREYFQKVILERAIPPFREWLAGLDRSTMNARRTIRECWYEVETGQVKWVELEPG